MRQTAGLISTYSSDEFGICSALYELGGMVVMHDASGCNSTYTTHDEPRWYTQDSQIFISAISEMEAIMGDDEKLIRDIEETAAELKPAFVAIVGAPIPYMIGTDLEAIAAVCEGDLGIPCIGFPANGMNLYTSGISMALNALVHRFCNEAKPRTEHFSVNVIGATPLDFSMNGSVPSIVRFLEASDIQVVCQMAMGSTLEAIAMAPSAHASLVISYGGLAAAEYLWKKYSIPYVVGVPFGKHFSKEIIRMLKIASDEGRCINAYTESEHMLQNSGRHYIIGENIFSASLAWEIEAVTGRHVKVLCPLDTEDELLRAGDMRTPEEDDLMAVLDGADSVIADPMYLPLVKENTVFYPLPHEAFSGRIYDPVNPDMIDKDLKTIGVIQC